MSRIGDILCGRTKSAIASIDPVNGGNAMDGGGLSSLNPPAAMPTPPAPMPMAPPAPASVAPKPIPNTTPQSRSPGVKAGSFAKKAMPVLSHAQDFLRGAGQSAEDLLQKSMSPVPDTYVTSLQTQTPDYGRATPTRGPDFHAAALSLVH